MSQNPLSNRKRAANRTSLPSGNTLSKRSPAATTPLFDSSFVPGTSVLLAARANPDGSFLKSGTVPSSGMSYFQVRFNPADESLTGSADLTIWVDPTNPKFHDLIAKITGKSFAASPVSVLELEDAFMAYNFYCKVDQDRAGYWIVKLIERRVLKA
jgi:hypothetical protein